MNPAGSFYIPLITKEVLSMPILFSNLPLFWILLAVINLITFILYGIDKQRARKKQWRIRESVLIGMAVIGGSIGALAGMAFFRHKTLKPVFRLGIPLILLVQVILLILASRI